MTRQQAAERLRRAEVELQRAQREHDGSAHAAARYQSAHAELRAATWTAMALLAAELTAPATR